MCTTATTENKDTKGEKKTPIRGRRVEVFTPSHRLYVYDDTSVLTVFTLKKMV